MAPKRILYQSAACEKIRHGATSLADAVRVTPGPKSKKEIATSMPRARNASILCKLVLSLQPRLCASRWKMLCVWQASCFCQKPA